MKTSKCPLPNSSILSRTFDHNGGVLTSKDGIELIIPKGAIKNGDLVTFNLAVGMCGPFIIPSKSPADLASPYYWIGVSGSYCFQKPIQVEFEHFGACDPSHYQLLYCEDDDESYTMKPVNYDLSFTKHNSMLCKFLTNHCCSLCLLHDYKDTNVNSIGAFFLKPENSQSLGHLTVIHNNFNSYTYFSVEIWFSFITSYCTERNKELFEERGMILDSSYRFEASTDKNSENYFKLQYREMVNGWHIDNGGRSKEIEAKEVNFRNDPNINEETLKAKENSKLFPPCYRLFVKNPDSPYDTAELDTIITVSLHNNKEEKELASSNFKILVPKYCSPIKDRIKELSKPSNSCLPNHRCYIPELRELIKYSPNIASHWESIALELEIPTYKINVFHINNPNDEEKKCYNMFDYWLQKGNSRTLCWCHFVQALRTVELHSTAEEVMRKHLSQCSDHESGSMPASPTSRLAQEKNTLDFSRLMRYLRPLNDVMECDLLYFVTLLLPDNGLEVAMNIKRSGNSKEKKIMEICKAFLQEETASWNRLHKALEEAGFKNVADKVKVCQL